MNGKRMATPTELTPAGFPKVNFGARSYWSRTVKIPRRGHVPRGEYPVGSPLEAVNWPPAAFSPSISAATSPPHSSPQRDSRMNKPVIAITSHLP